MSETTVKYRKTPKTPFVAANILLAALGASLVFFGPDPWSTSTVVLVVLCLGIGGVLTLLPFLLDQFALLNMNRTRASQAAVNLKAALQRTDEILEELRERKIEENPLRLVSERLPDLVEEKLGEAIRRSNAEASSQREEILRLMGSLDSLPKDIERAHDDLRTLSAHAATREFLETGLANLSMEVQRLEIKFDDLRRIRLFGTGDEQPAVMKEEKAPEPALHEENDPIPPESSAEEVSPAQNDVEADNDTSEQIEVEQPPLEQERSPEQDSVNTESEESQPPVPEPSPEIAPPPAEPEPETKPARAAARKKKPARVIVSAFVGIQNGIYLRGDSPHLSQDEGVRLEMTGIGEWVWSGETQEPLTAELFLNDESPSDIGPFQINPGDVLKLNPSFPGDKTR